MASNDAYDPLEDDDLVAAIEALENNSQAHGELAEERIEALERYLGEPYGNEVDGRSQVVSRDTWDTIEWIKPQLADIFCGGDEVVAFSARGPEDEQASAQETDYVNWTVTQRNNWFEIWNSWSHDALLQKVGYVLAYWDDSEDRTKERYEGLTDDEFALLQHDPEVELQEHEMRPLMGGALPMMLHDCVFERVRAPEVVRLENVPPENVRVSKNARSLSLQDPRLDFVEHIEKKTISELRAEGFDVPDDVSDEGDSDSTFESEQRDRDNPLRDAEGDEADPTMRRVTVRHVWIRYDCDGDGRAELRDVVIIGKTIYQNDETDVVNLVAQCPYVLPHQHTGLSVYDAVKDLEEIKTALLRAGLDNQYLANNGRYAIDVEAVNLDDMLDSRPGGIVRVKGGMPANQAVFPLTHPTTGEGAVGMIEYIDRVRQQRTGVNEQSQGLDQNTLNRTFGGAQLLLTAAQQRIKFIARVFAETGVKNLFQVVHQLTLTHSRRETIVKLRGQWVPVDPRQWKKRTDMQISVALGAGDKPQQMAFLGQTLDLQMKLVSVGLASPLKVYNTLSRMSRIAGYRDPNEFWDDPQKAPPKPQGPPPEVQKELAKGQVAMQLDQAQGNREMQQAQLDAQVQRQNKQAELQVQAANDQRDAQRQALEAQLQASADAAQRQHEAMLERMKLMEDRFEANLRAQVDLMIAGMGRAMQPEVPGYGNSQPGQ